RQRWRGWLYRLTRNAAIDFGQATRRHERRLRPLSQEFEAAGRTAPPDIELAAQESQRRILAAIQALPATYREPFILRHLEDWSYAQIAESLDMPIDTVES